MEQKALVSLIEEASKYNIRVLQPDVNTSDTNFIAKDGKIYFGMAGIKGVGASTVDHIVAVRGEQLFTSIFDFAVRVEQCNKRVLEALICSGAFDTLYGKNSRSCLFASVDMILEYSKKVIARNNNEIEDLFATGDTSETIQPPELIFAPEWDDLERINYEKDCLSFYLSGHPLDKYYSVVMSLNSIDVSSSEVEDDVSEVEEVESISIYGYVSGMVTAIRKREDKSKNTIAFVTIQSYNATIELQFWSDSYKKYSSLMEVGNVLCCQGKIEKDAGDIAKVSVDEVYDIESAIGRYADGLELKIEQVGDNITKLDAIKDYQQNSLSIYNSKIYFTVYNKETDYQQKYSTTNINIPYTLESVNFFVDLFGRENVLLSVKTPVQSVSNKRS